MVASRSFPECTLTFDDRYSPLLISIWSGRADLEAAKWHGELNREASKVLVARGLPIVSISDALASERPGPDVRKFWADSIAQESREITEATIATFVAFGSPLMRGVLTAIGWLNAEARKIKTTATMAEAIELALAKLAEAGVARPEGLTGESYRPPDVSVTAASS